jgi:hypothetical protein
MEKGLGLWYLMPLSIIFQLLVYRDGQFYWLRKPEYSEKTIDLPQVTENFITIPIKLVYIGIWFISCDDCNWPLWIKV